MGYHKPFSGLRDSIAGSYGHGQEPLQPLHEASAWQLAREMGPPWSERIAPVVVRELSGEVGSFIAERPGVAAFSYVFDSQPDGADDVAFFDAVIGNQDRHRGNFLVDDSGDEVTIWPIDHGYTFARPTDYSNYEFLQYNRITKGDGLLREHETAALKRLVASPTLLGVRPVIGDERADAVVARAQRMLNSGALLRSFEADARVW